METYKTSGFRGRVEEAGSLVRLACQSGGEQSLGLETPLKVVSNRRSLADEAELIGRLWYAATDYMLSEDVRLGIKPTREWLQTYRRINVRDLNLTLDTRICLSSGYKERNIVRSLGAHWDKALRSWYINIWQDPMPFRDWLAPGDFRDLIELAGRIASSGSPG